MYKALLCDLDGTLADTEPQHCSAWLHLLAERYDRHYDEHWFEQWVGTSDTVVAKWLIEETGLEVEAEDIILEKQELFHREVRADGRAFPGVAEQLARITAEYPLAIATNSHRPDADVVVPALGLDRYTDVVTTASDVEHLKPAPDIYLLAAERLAVDPRACIAIEDSTPGGDSARAAGCYVIGLNERVTAADEIVADNGAALARAYDLLRG